MTLSEISQLKKQIDLEIESARRALYAPASVASHASITARMVRMTVHMQALEDAGMTKELKELLESDDLWIKQVEE